MIVLDIPGLCIEELCNKCYLVRGFPNNAKHPGYWNWVGTVHIINAAGDVELKGFSISNGKITASQFRAMRDYFNLPNFKQFKRMRLKYSQELVA